jgi:hypothetical protein
MRIVINFGHQVPQKAARAIMPLAPERFGTSQRSAVDAVPVAGDGPSGLLRKNSQALCAFSGQPVADCRRGDDDDYDAHGVAAEITGLG